MWPIWGLVLAGAAAALQVPPGNETARMARFVAHNCDWGALATISTHYPVRGQPFANVFSISDGEVSKSSGVPYMYLTSMEISVQDLQVNANASLTLSLAQTSYCKKKNYDPQNPLCAHVIFHGVVEKVSGTEGDFAKTAMLSRHPEMQDWPPDHDWFFAKLTIANIWVLSHFGGIEMVTPEDYFNATPLKIFGRNDYLLNSLALCNPEPQMLVKKREFWNAQSVQPFKVPDDFADAVDTL